MKTCGRRLSVGGEGCKIRILYRFSGLNSWKEASGAKAGRGCGVLLGAEPGALASSDCEVSQGTRVPTGKNGVGASPGTEHNINSSGSESWTKEPKCKIPGVREDRNS